MKKLYPCFAAAVLTFSLLTGCGCRNSAPAPTTETTMPTMATTVPTTEAATVPTTQMTTEPTDATIQDGNGPMATDTTDPTESGNTRSRSGGLMGGMNSGNGITGSIK